MKILINTLSHSTGHQIVDAWHAYIQHLNNYNQPNEYTIDDRSVKPNKHDYNLTILLADLSDSEEIKQIVHEYDIVLICNNCEPLQVGNPETKDLVENHSHVFLISNSYLGIDHQCREKIIWFPFCLQLCRDFWTRHFYPQYYDLCNFNTDKKTNSLFYINGANRTSRQLFIDYLKALDSSIVIKNNITEQICEMGESQWESVEDSEFRYWVNQQYNNVLLEEHDNPYYDNSVSVGINEKFGKIPPGFFHLPLYFEHACIIFPESSWQNNELSITEKAIKCFYAESLPFPIAGANVNRLYNEIGFYTAWNLLPPEMQSFDGILDHNLRYQKFSYAVKWLADHPEVFDSDEYRTMTQQNKINVLTCKCYHQSVLKFDQLLKKFITQ
jgi:hypothetical protein